MIDNELEKAIDEAGREAVFAIMRAAGWSSVDQPPKWAWWEAVRRAIEGPAR